MVLDPSRPFNRLSPALETVNNELRTHSPKLFDLLLLSNPSLDDTSPTVEKPQNRIFCSILSYSTSITSHPSTLPSLFRSHQQHGSLWQRQKGQGRQECQSERHKCCQKRMLFSDGPHPRSLTNPFQPYAIQSSDDSYTGPAPNAYQQAKANYGASDAASVRSAAPSYQSQAPGYEPNAGYNSAGYGQNRYDSGNGMAPAPSRGPAGYGGLGRTDSSETTVAQKNALFGDAPQRMAAASASQQPPAENSGYGASGDGGYGGGSYGQDRQLTEEEQEEEDVQATKQQVRDTHASRFLRWKHFSYELDQTFLCCLFSQLLALLPSLLSQY